MVQPFLEAVDHAGEIALHFLGGEFSHAVRKAAMLPRGGDPGEGLFVEEQISAAEPSAGELDLAQRALDAVPFEPRGPPVCPRRSPSGPGRPGGRAHGAVALPRLLTGGRRALRRRQSRGARPERDRALRRAPRVHGFDPLIPRVRRGRNLGNLKPWSRSPIPGAERSAACASRSPTSATSAAATACLRRASSGSRATRS